MNIFVTVEGKAEDKVYKRWIPYVNPQITYAGRLVSDLTTNSFAIVSGRGFPYYFRVMRDAIEDVNAAGNVDKLVIAVDSEDMTREEKLAELWEFVRDENECPPCAVPINLVVQHFCLETWALGNRRVGPRNPASQKLQEYKQTFCVYENDPELLPPYPPRHRTRAQFAKAYLKAMINDWNKQQSYSTKRPGALFPQSYFNEVKKRHDATEHIVSFESFLTAFR
jgi:hypothetical protein